MPEEMMTKIRALKQKYETEGFVILGVFGSWARAEQTSGSDIDILYRTESRFEAEHSGWDIYARIDEIRTEIKEHLRMEVDLANIDTLDDVGKHFILPEVVYVA